MNAASPHARWVVCLAAALLFFSAVSFLSQAAADHLRDENLEARQARDDAARKLLQWQDDAQTALTIQEHLSAKDIERLLEPGNPDALTAKLEPVAASSRLANVVFSLGAPMKWDGQPDFASIEGATCSALTFEADAPHDGDIFAFLQRLVALQGKFVLKTLHIAPLHEKEAETPLTSLNLHMKAHFDWIANRPTESEGL